ncbi:hypothetical protein WJX72_001279 [[Myrmecia] bisecta]|uniref:Signal recognition particle receptor subunit beta n=1 Tax=[Myrmecia] bisecta TaxID=41462 RepID=A0AAW1R3U6_9CHLO
MAELQHKLEQLLEPILTQLPEELSQHLRGPVPLALLLAALLLLLWGLVRSLFGTKRGNIVLLVGPCNSGKTSVFLQLRDGTTHSGTVASMQENVDAVLLRSDKSVPPKSVQLVDIPGHPRVRSKFEQYVDRASCIVFLVDSVDFMPQKTDVAEQLYEVLANATVRKRRLPVLLACNKADMGPKAHTVEFIRKRLEKEIDQLRSTRNAMGDGTRVSSEKDLLRDASEPFSFDALVKSKGPKVSSASLSAAAPDTVELERFIRRHTP